MRVKIISFSICFFFFLCFPINGQDWQYDYDEAMSLAKENKKKVLLVFTGSDWCPPCIKLEKNILSKEVFLSFAKKNFVLLRADFPKRKKNKLSQEQQEKNDQLANRYNNTWKFPVILVIDATGNVLGKTGYKRGFDIDEYISLLTQYDSQGI